MRGTKRTSEGPEENDKANFLATRDVQAKGKRMYAWYTIFVAFVLILFAFDLIVIAWGERPASILSKLMIGTWGTSYGIGQVLFKATSIVCAAVAAQIALRAGLFHIGIEGTSAIAAISVGAIGALLPPSISSWVAVPLLCIVALVAGALWSLPIAILRVRFGAHEVLSGIMLNRIASLLVGYVLARGLAEPGSIHTPMLPNGARLSRLSQLPGLHVFHGSAVNLACVLVFILAIFWSYVARRSIFGREIRALGASPSVAEATGISVTKLTLIALACSGAVAGLTALNDVMGYKGYAEEGLGAGVGFLGLAAALIAESIPSRVGPGARATGVLFASLLFATLSQGGLSINAHIPMELVDMLIAMIVIVVSISPRITERLRIRTLSL